MDAVPIVPPLFQGTKNTTLHELQTADRSRATDIHGRAGLFGAPNECNLAVSLTARRRLIRLTWARQRGGARRPELIPPVFCVRRTIRTVQIAASPESWDQP